MQVFDAKRGEVGVGRFGEIIGQVSEANPALRCVGVGQPLMTSL